MQGHALELRRESDEPQRRRLRKAEGALAWPVAGRHEGRGTGGRGVKSGFYLRGPRWLQRYHGHMGTESPGLAPPPALFPTSASPARQPRPLHLARHKGLPHTPLPSPPFLLARHRLGWPRSMATSVMIILVEVPSISTARSGRALISSYKANISPSRKSS